MYVHLVCGGCAVRGPHSVIGALTLPCHSFLKLVARIVGRIHCQEDVKLNVAGNWTSAYSRSSLTLHRHTLPSGQVWSVHMQFNVKCFKLVTLHSNFQALLQHKWTSSSEIGCLPGALHHQAYSSQRRRSRMRLGHDECAQYQCKGDGTLIDEEIHRSTHVLVTTKVKVWGKLWL